MDAIYKKARRILTGKKIEEGATLVEYAMLVALIALACVTAITLMGGGMSGLFDRIRATLDAALSL